MMGKLQETLMQLKDDLISIHRDINPDIKLTRNTKIVEGEANLRLADYLYGRKDILPENFIVSQDSFTDSNNSEYSRKALQAIFNIVDIASARSTLGLIGNLGSLKNNFSFLDKRTRVPKIIDPLTYKAGLALQKSLHTVLSDQQLLAEIPDIMGSRNTVISQFIILKSILDKRLIIYETHTPEYIATINQWFSVRREIDSLQKQIKTTLDQQDKFQLFIMSEVNKDLTGNTNAIEDMINRFTSNHETLNADIKHLTELNNALSKKIADHAFPDSIMISSLADMLINYPSSEKNVLELKNTLLANDKNSELSPDEQELIALLTPGKKNISRQQSTLLEMEWLNLYQNDDMQYKTEKTASILKNSQKENQQALDSLINYQHHYPNQLAMLQQRLEQEKYYASPPVLKNEINTFNRNNPDDREAILVHDEERLQQDFNQLRLAKEAVVSIEATYDRYYNETYKPGIKKIHEEYNPQLAQLTSGIKKLEKKITARSRQIDDAKHHLKHYLELLTHNSDFYFPTNKIPKEALITYLEMDEENNELIHAIYKKAAEGQHLRWFGFTHIWNRAFNNPVFGNAFYDDRQYITTLINNKWLSLTEAEDASSLKKDNLAKEDLEQRRIEIQNEKQIELDCINKEHRQSCIQLNMAKYNVALKSISHRQSQLTKKIHTLDFDLIAIETNHNELQKTLQEKPIASLTANELESLKQDFGYLNGWSDEKRPAYDLSPSALYREIHHIAKKNNEAWKELDAKDRLSGERETLHNESIALSSALNELDTYFCDLSKRIQQTMIIFNRDIALRSFDLEITEPLIEQYTQLHAKVNATKKRPADKKTYDKLSDVLKKIDELSSAIWQSRQHDKVINHKIPGFSEKIENLSTKLKLLREEAFSQLMQSQSQKRTETLHIQYFGHYGIETKGIFGDYLKERANTFWKSDLFESFISLMTGMHYRSNATKRMAYISNLQWLSKQYDKDPDNIDVKTRLLNKINEGIREFKPRNPAEPDSLRSKLQAFKSAINPPELNKTASNTQYTRQ